MLGEDHPLSPLAAIRILLRAGRTLAAPLVAIAVLAGCTPSGSGDSSAGATASSAARSPGSSATGTTASPTPLPTPARLLPRPRAGQCYRLHFQAAVAPTTSRKAVPCARRGVTARTFYVGDLAVLAQGHLLAVDSSRVQTAVSTICPKKLATYLKADPDSLRLSMLRAIWFTPTVEQSDRGADWVRCDLVAIARDGRLAPMNVKLRGLMAGDWREHYGLCGTAAPDDPTFTRVICSAPHTWSALSVVPLRGKQYPGVEKVRGGGSGCEEVARAEADDALDFRWGYEWPTPEQWDQGRTYGVCWAPSDGS